MTVKLKKWIGPVISVLSLMGAIPCAGSCYAQEQQFSQTNSPPPAIDKTGLLILIRQTLTALDLSNKSGNYTILREISAPGFSASNDSIRLSNIFKRQRESGIDYSETLVKEPQFDTAPEITREGYLHFKGFYPSYPKRIKFEMLFAAVHGHWKLFGISADLATIDEVISKDQSLQGSSVVPVMSNTAINPVRQGFTPMRLGKLMY